VQTRNHFAFNCTPMWLNVELPQQTYTLGHTGEARFFL